MFVKKMISNLGIIFFVPIFCTKKVEFIGKWH